MTRRGYAGRAALLAAGALALGLSACAGGAAAPPDGWRLLETHRLSVAVPDSWGEVDPATSDGLWQPRTGYWDTLLQDTTDFTDPNTGQRFVAASQWGLGDPDLQPTGDAREALEYAVVIDPFDNAAYPLPDPVEVRSGEVTVWRQDLPTTLDGDGPVYYLWAAADGTTGDTVIVGLAGRTVTEEMRDVIDETLTVVPDSE